MRQWRSVGESGTRNFPVTLQPDSGQTAGHFSDPRRLPPRATVFSSFCLMGWGGKEAVLGFDWGPIGAYLDAPAR